MKPVIDLTKEYGIVLEGGGAKGAYQIGAWKALKEAGVKIKGIAGTSVGALNGALMCMNDYDNAVQVWESISYSKIMDVDDEQMSRLLDGKLPLRDFFELAFQAMKDGGVDVTPLKELIAAHVNADKILNSPVEFYILTFSVDEFRELDVDVKELEPELIPDLLLASAYIFPLFKNEKLHGKMFVDGGVINNVPLGSLVDRGYEDIIMLRIFGIGREKRVKIPEGTHIYSVEPRVDLGNIIEFDAEKSKLNMRIGYYDAMRMVYGLSGTIYYIDEDYSEEKCLNKLCEYNNRRSLRHFVESSLPAVARRLKLGPGWSYRELYLGLVEALAKICRIPKYHIYTLEDLEHAIWERITVLEDYDELPALAKLIFNQQEDEDNEFERT